VQDELLDLLGDTRSSKIIALLAAVELLGNQSLVPSHESIGCGQGAELFESFAAKRVSKRSETAALRVGKPQSAATELGFEDAIFFSEIGDDFLLMPIDLAGEHGDQDMQDHGLSSG
jgi:hypothetical protein